MARLAQAWLLVLDGRETVLHFDEVGQPVFSPDGARVAYSAKREKKWFVILGIDAPASSYEKTGRPVFSRDGQHLAFPAKRSGKWGMVSDGGEAGGQFDDVEPGMFSPGGKRLAYAARRGAKWIAVLDGKEGPPFDRNDGPAFNPDGRRFGYEGTEIKSSFTGDKGRGRVVDDGEQGPECEGSPIQLANRQLLDPRQWSGLLPWALTRGGLDAELKPRLLYRFLDVSAPVFSGDGARVAYVWRRAKNDEAVFVDGTEGKRYDRVFARTFAPMETVAMTYAARAGRKFVRVTQPLPTLP